MTYVRSFSQIERELMHHYRDQLNHAESEEDVKKFFTQTIHRLLDGILDDSVRIDDGDIVLDPDRSPHFVIGGSLADDDGFQTLQQQSDLTAVLQRFAEPAAKHCQHLRGHPEKTESKIRHRS